MDCQNPKCAWFFALSSSSDFLDCKNPKCAWVSGLASQNYSQTCPCNFHCGLGTTLGRALTETLNFPQEAFIDLIVGCSVSSNHIDTGIVGFGRTPVSLPSQLGLSKFSYCLVSRDFPIGYNTSETSELVMYRGSGSVNGSKQRLLTMFSP